MGGMAPDAAGLGHSEGASSPARESLARGRAGPRRIRRVSGLSKTSPEVYGESFGLQTHPRGVYGERTGLRSAQQNALRTFPQVYRETCGLSLTPACGGATLRLGMDGTRGNRGNSEGAALDLATAASLVARVVGDIDGRGTPEGYVLLDDLLCAAWPTERGQCQ